MTEPDQISVHDLKDIAMADDPAAMHKNARAAAQLWSAYEYAKVKFGSHLEDLRRYWTGQAATRFTEEAALVHQDVAEVGTVLQAHSDALPVVADTMRQLQVDAEDLVAQYEAEVADLEKLPPEQARSHRDELDERYRKLAVERIRESNEIYHRYNNGYLAPPREFRGMLPRDAQPGRSNGSKIGLSNMESTGGPAPVLTSAPPPAAPPPALAPPPVATPPPAPGPLMPAPVFATPPVVGPAPTAPPGPRVAPVKPTPAPPVRTAPVLRAPLRPGPVTAMPATARPVTSVIANNRATSPVPSQLRPPAVAPRSPLNTASQIRPGTIPAQARPGAVPAQTRPVSAMGQRLAGTPAAIRPGPAARGIVRPLAATPTPPVPNQYPAPRVGPATGVTRRALNSPQVAAGRATATTAGPATTRQPQWTRSPIVRGPAAPTAALASEAQPPARPTWSRTPFVTPQSPEPAAAVPPQRATVTWGRTPWTRPQHGSRSYPAIVTFGQRPGKSTPDKADEPDQPLLDPRTLSRLLAEAGPPERAKLLATEAAKIKRIRQAAGTAAVDERPSAAGTPKSAPGEAADC